MIPRWYFPRGGIRPSHCPHPGGLNLVDGVGPDADPGNHHSGGGVVCGGPYERGQPGWVKTTGGWWVNFSDCVPQHLVRMQRSPRIIHWATVAGAEPDHWWAVPVLLRPTRGADGEALTYASALDQVWRGDRWADDPQLADLQQRLLHVARGQAHAPDGSALDDAEAARLVADLLGEGQHISVHELSAVGWLTQSMLLRVLIAAADIPPITEAHHV